MGVFGHFSYNRFSLLFIDKTIWLEISDIPIQIAHFHETWIILCEQDGYINPLFLTKVSAFNAYKQETLIKKALILSKLFTHLVSCYRNLSILNPYHWFQ